METIEKDALRIYIRKEYGYLTDENGFAYGWLSRRESHHELGALLKIARTFELGDNLVRDLESAINRLGRWIDEHPTCY